MNETFYLRKKNYSGEIQKVRTSWNPSPHPQGFSNLPISQRSLNFLSDKNNRLRTGSEAGTQQASSRAIRNARIYPAGNVSEFSWKHEIQFEIVFSLRSINYEPIGFQSDLWSGNFYLMKIYCHTILNLKIIYSASFSGSYLLRLALRAFSFHGRIWCRHVFQHYKCRIWLWRWSFWSCFRRGSRIHRFSAVEAKGRTFNCETVSWVCLVVTALRRNVKHKTFYG